MKAAPVIAMAFGLLSVMVSVEVWPLPMVAGENALATVGGASTVRVAVLLTGPAGVDSTESTPLVVLAYAPAIAEVTLIEIEQVPPTLAIAPPVSWMPASPPPALSAPAVIPSQELTVPPQVELSAGGLAVSRPAGNRSSKLRPVIAAAVLLVRVKLSVAVPATGMVETEKALLMVGFGVKSMLALAVVPVPPLLEDTMPVVLV